MTVKVLRDPQSLHIKVILFSFVPTENLFHYVAWIKWLLYATVISRYVDLAHYATPWKHTHGL